MNRITFLKRLAACVVAPSIIAKIVEPTPVILFQDDFASGALDDASRGQWNDYQYYYPPDGPADQRRAP